MKDKQGYWRKKKKDVFMQASAEKAAVQKSQPSTDSLTNPMEYSRGFFQMMDPSSFPDAGFAVVLGAQEPFSEQVYLQIEYNFDTILEGQFPFGVVTIFFICEPYPLY